MIGYLQGTLVEKNPPTVCLDVQGVGYEVDVSMSTFYQLPDLGNTIKLYTHLAIREDAHLLFGFSSHVERSTFRQLIKVSGIGARTALAILSNVTADELAHIIAEQDSNRLIKVPGIGKKTAERLLLELKDKLGTPTHVSTSTRSQHNDIQQALLALGYSDKEVAKVLRDVPEDSSVNEGIRLALKQLSR